MIRECFLSFKAYYSVNVLFDTLSGQVICDYLENWVINFFVLPFFFFDCCLRDETRLDALVFSSSVVIPKFLTKDNDTASAEG